jgi:hypothetical protein
VTDGVLVGVNVNVIVGVSEAVGVCVNVGVRVGLGVLVGGGVPITSSFVMIVLADVELIATSGKSKNPSKGV